MIDLKDCTFLIPTLIDTNDRLQNLLVVVKYLTTHFNTNIFIGEQANLRCIVEEKLKSHGLNHPSVECFRIKFAQPLPHFFRAGIFNCLATEAKTKCIAVYDTDVLVKNEQFEMTYKQIIEDKFDMIYPYDGNFLDVRVEDKNKIFNSMDLNDVNLSTTRNLNPHSLGGAVFYNRDVFIKGGMENENFRGWGQEDFEREARYRILGYRQCRLTGPLFHFHHGRGEKAEFYIPNSDRNNAMLYHKISNMNKEQLEKEVQSWGWWKNVK